MVYGKHKVYIQPLTGTRPDLQHSLFSKDTTFNSDYEDAQRKLKYLRYICQQFMYDMTHFPPPVDRRNRRKSRDIGNVSQYIPLNLARRHGDESYLSLVQKLARAL